jgi:hypothetical protein
LQWRAGVRLPTSRTFTFLDDPALVRAYQPRVRPDGFGLWAENGRRVPFFLEYDTGAEQLSVLATKIVGYYELFTTIGRSWPVLFWLHAAARERNLRSRLADLPAVLTIATGARDHAASHGLTPADHVWATGRSGVRATLAALAPSGAGGWAG